jgi:hypothetical protein
VWTATGFLGIAPQATLNGDQVCILGGSQVPFILRKSVTPYVMTGECYIHGIMDGEVPRGDCGKKDTVTFDIW